MYRTIILAAVILEIVGCAQYRRSTQAPSSNAPRPVTTLNPDNSLYACRAEAPGSGADSSHVRVVSIGQATGSHGLVLALDTEPAQLLAPVPDTDRKLYANAHLAWSANSKATVLTDVDNIQTYACRSVTYGDAMALLRSEGAGGPTSARSGT
jgi:hypothetical protein